MLVREFAAFVAGSGEIHGDRARGELPVPGLP
jgi:hypothetical protein